MGDVMGHRKRAPRSAADLMDPNNFIIEESLKTTPNTTSLRPFKMHASEDKKLKLLGREIGFTLEEGHKMKTQQNTNSRAKLDNLDGNTRLSNANVAVHNTAEDCWVALNGKVLDMTGWLADQFRLCTCRKHCSCVVKNWYCADDCVEYCPCFKRGFPFCDKRRLAMTILAFAGKDISHWFKGSEWIRYTHPVTGTRTTYRPYGHGPHEPVVPSTKWRPYVKPWWLDDKLVVGKLSARTRSIKIVNTLTSSNVILEVCSEETIYEIMMRYLPHNAHLSSYTWRHEGRGLRLSRTLAQNGIPDERDRFSAVLLPENIHIPAILIYYNDDLTEEMPPNPDVCHCLEKDEECHAKPNKPY